MLVVSCEVSWRITDSSNTKISSLYFHWFLYWFLQTANLSCRWCTLGVTATWWRNVASLRFSRWGTLKNSTRNGSRQTSSSSLSIWLYLRLSYSFSHPLHSLLCVYSSQPLHSLLCVYIYLSSRTQTCLFFLLCSSPRHFLTSQFRAECSLTPIQTISRSRIKDTDRAGVCVRNIYIKVCSYNHWITQSNIFFCRCIFILLSLSS